MVDVKTIYEKRYNFSTTKVDGIFGGITNGGEINMNFFIETTDTPSEVVILVDESNGQVISEKSRISKGAIIREMPFGINIDHNVAKTIVTWLNQRILEVENANGLNK